MMHGGRTFWIIQVEGECQNGLTQCAVAEVLNTSQTMYARYERGANEMPIHHLVTLCRLYNVSADYFLDTAPVSDRKRRRGAKKA